MMRKDPRERVSSAGAVIEKLTRWIPAEPVAMPRTKRHKSQPARAALAAGSGAATTPADGGESGTVEFSSVGGGQRTPGLLSEAAETRADSQPSLGGRNLLLPFGDAAGPNVTAGDEVAEAGTSSRLPGLLRRGRTAIVRVAIAAVAGIGFSLLMFLLSRIHPRSAQELLGDGGFTMLGGVIFTLVLLGQIALAPPPPEGGEQESPPPP
jgi:hypothetical protein